MSSEPAWFIAMVDQRVALAVEANQLAKADFVFTTLKEPDLNQDPDEWEYTCDHCSAFVPESMVTVHVTRDIGLMQVLVVGGLCRDCAWFS